MKGTVVVRGAALAQTAAPSSATGHIVLDAFEEARPDRLAAPAQTPYLYASVALALLALARAAWVLRHW
jgi:hypothetical protein